VLHKAHCLGPRKSHDERFRPCRIAGLGSYTQQALRNYVKSGWQLNYEETHNERTTERSPTAHRHANRTAH
jgi:hypothetical protein